MADVDSIFGPDPDALDTTTAQNNNGNNNTEITSLLNDKHLGPLPSQKITPLNDNNWIAWKLRITDLLEVWDVFGHAEERS